MIDPHGGRLVDRTIDASRSQRRLERASDLPKIVLTRNELQDVHNIANGRFSPLRGFLNRSDFLKVAHDMTLEDGTVWSLPIVLTVDNDKATELNPDERALLHDPEGSPIGTIEVEEVYKYNKEEIAHAIFGTDDDAHPGVAEFYAREDFLVGGPVEVFEDRRYNTFDLLPEESRVLFTHYNWDRVVGFQTRNAPHRAHEHIQKTALEFVDGLLIQPKLGEKKLGDYKDTTIMEAYKIFVDSYYPNDSVALSVFPSRMWYAGPREAVFDAIVRKNHGCTHFIIGRDHAGVGDYYDSFDAHHVFEEIDGLGIEPMFFDSAFYCHGCDGMASGKTCPHDDERIYPSGSDLREQIRSGTQPSDKVMRSAVATFIIERDEPFVEA